MTENVTATKSSQVVCWGWAEWPCQGNRPCRWQHLGEGCSARGVTASPIIAHSRRRPARIALIQNCNKTLALCARILSGSGSALVIIIIIVSLAVSCLLLRHLLFGLVVSSRNGLARGMTRQQHQRRTGPSLS